MNGLRYAKRRYLWALDKRLEDVTNSRKLEKAPNVMGDWRAEYTPRRSLPTSGHAAYSLFIVCYVGGAHSKAPGGPECAGRAVLAVIVVSCCAVGYFSIEFPRHQLGIPGPLSPF